MKTMVNIALPKGRLGEKVYDLLKNAGFSCPELEEKSRKLVFENAEKGVRYFWVKPSDVVIYVERGAADIGIVGKDILLEYDHCLLSLSVHFCYSGSFIVSLGSGQALLEFFETFDIFTLAHLNQSLSHGLQEAQSVFSVNFLGQEVHVLRIFFGVDQDDLSTVLSSFLQLDLDYRVLYRIETANQDQFGGQQFIDGYGE